MSKWLGFVVSVIAVSQAGALLWHMIVIAAKGKVYFHEPNTTILVLGIVLLGTCLAFGLWGLMHFGRATRRRKQ